ncbi:MAG: hypothetical protein AAGU05_03010 [Anaerolineaceae bacterium]
MTEQFVLSQNQILELEQLDFRQAKRKVEELYHSIRSEKIRTFYCEMIRPYFLSLHTGRRRRDVFAGITVLNKQDLELMRVFGDTLEISRDVPPELAAEIITSVSVAGLIFASDAVWKALSDRVYSGVRG